MSPPVEQETATGAENINPNNNETKSSTDTMPTPATQSTSAPTTSTNNDTTTITQNDRLNRFKALQTRATASQKSNLAEARAEASRSSVDPSALTSLSRKAAIASHNILKADTEETEGTGAFERKRAWDYTIEESARWDERQAKKARNRSDVAFQDYSAEAGKIYSRQMRELEKSEVKGETRARAEYEASRAELVERAAQSGGLDIVETEPGS